MRRPRVLGILLGLLSLVAIRYVLSGVVATVFFALTVAYVATPVFHWLEREGVPSRIASGITTLFVFVGLLIVAAPLFLVVYRRQDVILDLIGEFPGEIPLEFAQYRFVVETSLVLELAREQVQRVAIEFATVAPVLLFKLALFVLVVYGVLLGKGDVRRALYAVVPSQYHDIVEPLERRTGATLWAIYVLQAATAVATFVIAVPVFWLLGYQFWLTLAVLAAILQFIPILGPSVLLAVLAVYHVTVGELGTAALVVVVGGVVIGWLPDGIVRPRLASRTTNLSGTLYFIGFIGGLLSVGTIGVIVGPLTVALIAELVTQLSDELRTPPPGDGSVPPSSDGSVPSSGDSSVPPDSECQSPEE